MLLWHYKQHVSFLSRTKAQAPVFTHAVRVCKSMRDCVCLHVLLHQITMICLTVGFKSQSGLVG